ncbi:hypothetical protein [Timonella sp. A28]|uniref:hypothetical protein n=1 Tax=Timonella sp. A28 TaxID=3442640 RepID=UPI003EBE9A80
MTTQHELAEHEHLQQENSRKEVWVGAQHSHRYANEIMEHVLSYCCVVALCGWFVFVTCSDLWKIITQHTFELKVEIEGRPYTNTIDSEFESLNAPPLTINPTHGSVIFNDLSTKEITALAALHLVMVLFAVGAAWLLLKVQVSFHKNGFVSKRMGLRFRQGSAFAVTALTLAPINDLIIAVSRDTALYESAMSPASSHSSLIILWCVLMVAFFIESMMTKGNNLQRDTEGLV